MGAGRLTPALTSMVQFFNAEEFGGVHFFAFSDVGEGEFGFQFAGGLMRTTRTAIIGRVFERG